ncbi:hypothetical protein SAMN05661091_5411 [Paenibacillus uliginis N3/975]|uniref:Uncharacterized protein n=1 Tax=Paenibacillus uliginis N3/975 TaxID=1313296 RepID=A0A1X7HQY3_9BACL|nr:hypothetical protein [Paenibacillus uliginis]SMF91300.1 hypothetical protein SAMN05661091_5411 [Paenibacillus uliginis N3/975]
MNSGNKRLTGRMDMGFYALNKLACAGAILLLLTIISWLWPASADSPASILGVSIPLEHWVYGYALIASLAADAIISLLPSLNNVKQAALYGAAGFLFFALFTGGDTDTFWVRGLAGAFMLLMYSWGKQTFTSQSLTTPFFALVVPLLCWFVI